MAISIDKLAFSIPEAAEIVSISPRKMWSLIRNAEIPAVHVGKRVLVTRDALIAYLNANSHFDGSIVRPEVSVRRRDSVAKKGA